MGGSGSGRKQTEVGDFMTFSEYFNTLYPYLQDDEKPVDFCDSMIGHFICEEAQEACGLLNCQSDTKRRYLRKKNPNKISPEYAQYVYSKHYEQGYREWLNARMFEKDTFHKIEEWLANNEINFFDVCAACDSLLEDIFFKIAYPNAPDGSEVKLPDKSPGDGEEASQLSANDRNLLKDFHIDFDGILEKCIASNQAEVWFTGSMVTKINSLYNEKWKDQISRFEDIGLQSNILSTIAALQDFCKALDPDSEPVPGSSVRRLRTKLRDNYVKLHPDNYAGIYPYDAFIDDWNNENEFDM